MLGLLLVIKLKMDWIQLFWRHEELGNGNDEGEIGKGLFIFTVPYCKTARAYKLEAWQPCV